MGKGCSRGKGKKIFGCRGTESHDWGTREKEKSKIAAVFSLFSKQIVESLIEIENTYKEARLRTR